MFFYSFYTRIPYLMKKIVSTSLDVLFIDGGCDLSFHRAVLTFKRDNSVCNSFYISHMFTIIL